MTRQLAEFCVDKFKDYREISEGNGHILIYGMEALIASVVGILLTIIISIVWKVKFAWIPFVISFSSIRCVAGGFHASTHLKCYIVSSLSYMACVICDKLTDFGPGIFAVCITIAAVIIIIFSPVESPNKPLRGGQRKRNRKISIGIIFADVVLAWTFAFLGINHVLLRYYYYGAILAAASLIAAKITIN